MAIDLHKHRSAARLTIRLMGIFFIVNGITGTISSGLDAYWDMRAFARAQNEYYPGQAIAWTIGSIVMLLIGLYMTFKGKMVLDAVFHESLETPAIPCPDCGYDLRGNPDLKKCPECGLEIAEKPAGSTTSSLPTQRP